MRWYNWIIVRNDKIWPGFKVDTVWNGYYQMFLTILSARSMATCASSAVRSIQIFNQHCICSTAETTPLVSTSRMASYLDHTWYCFCFFPTNDSVFVAVSVHQMLWIFLVSCLKLSWYCVLALNVLIVRFFVFLLHIVLPLFYLLLL